MQAMTILRSGRFYDIYRLEIEKIHENSLLERLVLEHFQRLTHEELLRHFAHKKILLNGKAATMGTRVQLGDAVTALIDKPMREIGVVKPEDIPLDVVYEDAHLMVINKPAGLVVHPGPGNWSGTLVNALVARYPNLPYQRRSTDKPGIVHRIDKETSGLLVCAKDVKTMEGLAQQFYEHTIDRTYYALIWDIPKYRHGTIEADIKRGAHNKRLRSVVAEDMGGKYAITHFKVLEKFYYLSLVQCNLETGRTHQIRVHMHHIGHPLFGDKLYGGDTVLKGKEHPRFGQLAEELLRSMPRQGLHATSLGFTHPITGERLMFECAFPADFQAVLDRLRCEAF